MVDAHASCEQLPLARGGGDSAPCEINVFFADLKSGVGAAVPLRDNAVGAAADLILLDRNALHNVPNYDDYAMIAYSAERSDVRMTMVDGRILYQNGTYTLIDEERLHYDAKKVFAHYFD